MRCSDDPRALIDLQRLQDQRTSRLAILARRLGPPSGGGDLSRPMRSSDHWRQAGLGLATLIGVRAKLSAAAPALGQFGWASGPSSVFGARALLGPSNTCARRICSANAPAALPVGADQRHAVAQGRPAGSVRSTCKLARSVLARLPRRGRAPGIGTTTAAAPPPPPTTNTRCRELRNDVVGHRCAECCEPHGLPCPLSSDEGRAIAAISRAGVRRARCWAGFSGACRR